MNKKQGNTGSAESSSDMLMSQNERGSEPQVGFFHSHNFSVRIKNLKRDFLLSKCLCMLIRGYCSWKGTYTLSYLRGSGL